MEISKETVRNYRRFLVSQILEICQEFNLSPTYHHISDLIKDLETYEDED